MSNLAIARPRPAQDDKTTDAERDYCAEMRAVIDQATADGAYVPRVIASEIVSKVTATDPDLLFGWLLAQAEHIVWQAINDRDRSTRARIRARAGGKAFRDALDEHDSGDSTPLLRFLNMPLTVEDGSRKQLANLTKLDLLFVADAYSRRAAENAMMSAFLTALSKKVGDGTVSDHFTDETLAELFTSLGGKQ